MSRQQRHVLAILNLRKALEAFFVGLTHFYKCINFDKSHLDAQAIRWMNESVGKVGEALKKVEGGD